MTYTIQTFRPEYPTAFFVVGCGGTGSYISEGLCQILEKDHLIVLIDPDRVEEHNLRRQLFYASDLGKFKSQVLAERLARQYGREVGYSVFPFDGTELRGYSDPFKIPGQHGFSERIILGCVDNAAARKSIAQASGNSWYIDAGNGEHSGQVLIGNTSIENRDNFRGAFDEEHGICTRLPVPTVQMPELLIPVPGEIKAPDCAERVQAGTQNPVINRVMAALVLDMVRKLLDGKLTWMGVSIDLEIGTMRPIEASPKTVARMVGLQEPQLMLIKKPVKERARIHVAN